MDKKVLFIFFVITVFVTGCKKLVLYENSDYQGVWKTECMGHGCDSHVIIIGDDNTAEYYTEGQEIELVHYKGKARIKDDVLKIGVAHSFHVDQPPTAKSDTVFSSCQCTFGEAFVYSWYMIIDNNTYYKQ